MGVKFLLDTNILSELSRKHPNDNIVTQMEKYAGQCATASVVMHEIRYGVERLPAGNTKDNLQAFLKQLVAYEFQVLPYDNEAASYHASERARLTGKGLTPSFTDNQIAATTVVNDLVLVTRNTRDFENFSQLTIENWFEANDITVQQLRDEHLSKYE